jgi:hypothetical protein
MRGGALAGLILAVTLSGCIQDGRGDDFGQTTGETGSFRFEGLSQETARWHLARYADFAATFGVTLPPDVKITMRSGGAPSSCSTHIVPGDFEYHFCAVSNGYLLECPTDVRECPLRLAEIFADMAGIRSQFLRDGLAEVLAGGVTAPGPFDLDWPDLRRDVIALLDDATYASKLEAAYSAYQDDWFYSLGARYGLRRTAGQFVALLIGRLGPRGALALMRARPDVWASLGLSVEQAAADFGVAQPRPGRSYTRLAVECAEPPVVPGTDEVIDFTVGSPVYSVAAPTTFHTRVRTLDLAEPATVDVNLSGESGPFVYVQDCADGTPLRQAGQLGLLIARHPVNEELRLPAGRYVLIFGTQVQSPGGSYVGTLRVNVAP